MKEDYVSFEVAKLLKEKGFDECCHKIYEEDGILYGNGDYFKNSDSDIKLIDDEDDDSHVFVTAPTLQMAMKWLREVHDLHVVSYPYKADNKRKWCCTVYKTFNLLGCEIYTDETLDSYEDAVESALKYCLTNLI